MGELLSPQFLHSTPSEERGSGHSFAMCSSLPQFLQSFLPDLRGCLQSRA